MTMSQPSTAPEPVAGTVPASGRVEDDWDTHWQALDEVSTANPAVRWRHHILMQRLGLNPPNDAKGMRVLDIGSGQGDFAAMALKVQPTLDFLGLELSQIGCDIAKRKAPKGHFHACDLMTDVKPDGEHANWASHAVCTEVLEHVEDPVTLLKTARHWMAPGCRLIVSVPGGPMSTFDRHIGHHRHYTPALLRQTLEDAGFEVVHCGGAGFPFFNLYRLAVVARGQKLVDSITGPNPTISPITRLAMQVFDVLFRFNLPVTSKLGQKLGFQMVAEARLPDEIAE